MIKAYEICKKIFFVLLAVLLVAQGCLLFKGKTMQTAGKIQAMQNGITAGFRLLEGKGGTILVNGKETETLGQYPVTLTLRHLDVVSFVPLEGKCRIGMYCNSEEAPDYLKSVEKDFEKKEQLTRIFLK